MDNEHGHQQEEPVLATRASQNPVAPDDSADSGPIDWVVVRRMVPLLVLYATVIFWASGVMYLTFAVTDAPRLLIHLINPFGMSLFVILIAFPLIVNLRWNTPALLLLSTVWYAGFSVIL